MDGDDGNSGQPVPSRVMYLSKPFPKGVSGNPSGKPKAFRAIRRKFQLALLEAGPHNAMPIAEKMIAAAANDDHPRQGEAWKIMTAYGIGLPEKSLDSDTVARLAASMVSEMILQAKAARAATATEHAPRTAPTEEGT